MAFKLPDLEQMTQLFVQFRQTQDFHDLFMDPFIVGNRIRATGNKQGLQKFLVSIVKPVKGLKVQPTFHIKWNMVKIVKAKPAHPFQSFPTQFLSVVREPLSFKLIQIAASLPERDTV